MKACVFLLGVAVGFALCRAIVVHRAKRLLPEWRERVEEVAMASVDHEGVVFQRVSLN